MNTEKAIDDLLEVGQVQQAVSHVLREIKKEYHNEFLKYIAIRSMRDNLFKGSRRAVSHISEPLKTELLLEIIKAHKSGFGFRNEIFHHAWLETIKMLPAEYQNEELLYFIRSITKTYVYSDFLLKRLKEAIKLLDEKTKRSLLLTNFRRRDLILIFCYENNNEILFWLNVLDGELRDRISSFVLRTILKFNKSKSFNYVDDKSVFTEVLSIGKTSNYVDRQMFNIVKYNLRKLLLGSNRYSGKELVKKLSTFMDKDEAEKIISNFGLVFHCHQKI
jgi:hypothetical protein